MFATSSSSFSVFSGLHFQLPPTIGLRPMSAVVFVLPIAIATRQRHAKARNWHARARQATAKHAEQAAQQRRAVRSEPSAYERLRDLERIGGFRIRHLPCWAVARHLCVDREFLRSLKPHRHLPTYRAYTLQMHSPLARGQTHSGFITTTSISCCKHIHLGGLWSTAQALELRMPRGAHHGAHASRAARQCDSPHVHTSMWRPLAA